MRRYISILMNKPLNIQYKTSTKMINKFNFTKKHLCNNMKNVFLEFHQLWTQQKSY